MGEVKCRQSERGDKGRADKKESGTNTESAEQTRAMEMLDGGECRVAQGREDQMRRKAGQTRRG